MGKNKCYKKIVDTDVDKVSLTKEDLQKLAGSLGIQKLVGMTPAKPASSYSSVKLSDITNV